MSARLCTDEQVERAIYAAAEELAIVCERKPSLLPMVEARQDPVARVAIQVHRTRGEVREDEIARAVEDATAL